MTLERRRFIMRRKLCCVHQCESWVAEETPGTINRVPQNKDGVNLTPQNYYSSFGINCVMEFAVIYQTTYRNYAPHYLVIPIVQMTFLPRKLVSQITDHFFTLKQT